MKVLLHILCYLMLAVICYGLAFVTDSKLAIALFVACGIIFELYFWREILFGFRKNTNH